MQIDANMNKCLMGQIRNIILLSMKMLFKSSVALIFTQANQNFYFSWKFNTISIFVLLGDLGRNVVTSKIITISCAVKIINCEENQLSVW